MLSPGGVPVRWLLMDGYVYDIRDDHDHPPRRRRVAAAHLWRTRQPAAHPGARFGPRRRQRILAAVDRRHQRHDSDQQQPR